MALKLKYTVDDVIEVIGPLRDFYEKGEDGKFHLAVDGDSPKLAEFRNSNRALNAQKTDLEIKLKAFEGIDPTEYHALKAKPDTSPRVAELEAQLAAERTAHDATNFSRIVTYEFLRQGGRESAVDFTVGNAAKDFKMVDGKPTTELFSPTNPGVPLTVAEWVQSQVEPYSFTFLPSRGGGARPGPNGPARKPSISSDPLSVGKNLEAIARGDVTVE